MCFCVVYRVTNDHEHYAEISHIILPLLPQQIADNKGNKDKKIDLQEYEIMFKIVYPKVEEKVITTMFFVYDVNDDGFIENKDFRELRKKMDVDENGKLTLDKFSK